MDPAWIRWRQPGEAGYGGQFMWDADKELTRYVGATITYISPTYDEYKIETIGYRELEKFETVACTQ
jgi:hypothetical protein